MLSDNLEIPRDTLNFLCEFLGSEPTIAPIGNGNTNTVFRAKFREYSAILKLPVASLLDSVADIQLPVQRNLLEQWALSQFKSTSPSTEVPAVLHSSALKPCFVMNDISPSISWHELSVEQRQNGVISVIRFCEDCRNRVVPTMPKPLEVVSSKMSSVIEGLSFVYPRTYQSPVYQTANADAEAKYNSARYKLQCSPDVRHVNELATNHYSSVSRNLIHGDLHNLSVLYSNSKFHIIDPEFCRIGCSSFDLGVFMAHVILFEAANTRDNISKDEFSEILNFLYPEFNSINDFLEEEPRYLAYVKMFCLNELFAKLVGPVPSYWLTKITGVKQNIAIELVSDYLIQEAREWCSISQISQ